MRMIQASVAPAVFALGLSVSIAWAQKGVGDPQGVARQPAKPKVVLLSGTVLEVRTEPCQTTTGRSPVGTHLLMKTSEGKTLNIHLGPAAAVEFVTRDLSREMDVKVEVFRTTKTEKGQYIARSLTFGDRTVELRDENLRPAWAGARGFPGRPRKIAVTAVKPSLDAAVDPRFGRCAYFVIVDSENGTIETLENTNVSGRGAGVQSAQMIASKGAKVLLTGKCGPSASDALSDNGIQVVSGCSGSVRDVIKRYKEGKLRPADDTKAVPGSGAGPRSSKGRKGSNQP